VMPPVDNQDSQVLPLQRRSLQRRQGKFSIKVTWLIPIQLQAGVRQLHQACLSLAQQGRRQRFFRFPPADIEQLL